MSSDRVSLSINRDLYSKIVEYVEKSGGEFKSVEEFVEFCLSEILSENRSAPAAYSKEEEEQLKERFKALGYI
ncbi:hypothetical protein HRbin01_01767 [archaeon HR01]|nr:hypothetical protein HRbin01_01767 [archaeon HR01]